MTTKEAITAQRIRLRRKGLRMTQEALAEACDVNRVTVSCWERGLYVPEGGTLQQLAGVLEVSPEYLLGQSADEHGNAVDRSIIRPPYSAMNLYSVPVISREYLVYSGEKFSPADTALEFLTWPQDKILALTKTPPTSSPYALYVEDIDYLSSVGIHRGDKIIVAPCERQEQGALSLIMYYGLPTFWFVYQLAEGVLLQNDAAEVLLTREQISASGYKFLGLVAGTVCNRPTPRPLLRRT